MKGDTSLKAGIIAAGLGERLKQGRIDTPKQLVKVLGEPLIARTIKEACAAGATEVACIVNDVYPEVAEYLRFTAWPVPLQLVVKTTPSSMESFFELEPYLNNSPFLLLTVDAIFPPGLLKRFVSSARKFQDADGVLAVTEFVDDEKPLRLLTDEHMRITEIGATVNESRFITAGFYFFDPSVYNEKEEARTKKFTAFRQFLTHLVEKKYRIYAEEVGKTVDVDVPGDIDKAEKFLKGLGFE
ncbi:MAG TPA: NDP-sugar synthase [Deltaproteobacteria bacterium]|nr:NDP-sugar synthase [Deltaproteobacteria bacterium]